MRVIVFVLFIATATSGSIFEPKLDPRALKNLKFPPGPQLRECLNLEMVGQEAVVRHTWKNIEERLAGQTTNSMPVILVAVMYDYGQYLKRGGWPAQQAQLMEVLSFNHMQEALIKCATVVALVQEL